MGKQKKTARLIIQGLSVLGILCGGMLVSVALATVLETQRETLGVLCGSLVLSAVLLAGGGYLIYTSYLMLRFRAFTAVTRGLPTLLAASAFGVAELVMSFANTLANETIAGYVKLSCAFVSVLVFCLGISVFTKLAKRLVEAAHAE